MLRRLVPLVLIASLGVAATARGDVPTFANAVRVPGSSGTTEPRLAIAPDGTRWIATSASGRLIVLRSSDGATWTTVTAPAPQNEPSIDVDIAVTPTGRVIVTELDLAAVSARVFYSDDKGVSWLPAVVPGGIDQDRQWLAVGPNDSTTGLPRVYFLWHNFVTGVAAHNMFVATSIDGGATFLPPVPITQPGSQAWLDLQCSDSGGPDGLHVDASTGRLFVSWSTRSSATAGGCTAQPLEFNIVFPTRIWAATSPDNSLGSWKTSLAVDGSADGTIVQEQGSVSTIDDGGNMYVFYDRPATPGTLAGASLSYTWASSDLSAWSTPVDIVAPGGPGNMHPHPIAGAPGKVELAWYSGEVNGSTVDWYVKIAQSFDALSAAPAWTISDPPGCLIPGCSDRALAYAGFTADDMLGHCSADGDPTGGVQDGLVCGRATDVWGIALDPQCNFLVAWAQSNRTFVTRQTGGPTVC
ncbi:MAG: sialidase family protein [Actinomycetota bacterium]